MAEESVLCGGEKVWSQLQTKSWERLLSPPVRMRKQIYCDAFFKFALLIQHSRHLKFLDFKYVCFCFPCASELPEASSTSFAGAVFSWNHLWCRFRFSLYISTQRDTERFLSNFCASLSAVSMNQTVVPARQIQVAIAQGYLPSWSLWVGPRKGCGPMSP